MAPNVLFAPLLGRHRHQRDNEPTEGVIAVYFAARAPTLARLSFALSVKFPTGQVTLQESWNTMVSTKLSRSHFLNIRQRLASALEGIQLALCRPNHGSAASVFGGRTHAAPWHSKPSWYVRCRTRSDQQIPDLERFLGRKRMNGDHCGTRCWSPVSVSLPRKSRCVFAGCISN